LLVSALPLGIELAKKGYFTMEFSARNGKLEGRRLGDAQRSTRGAIIRELPHPSSAMCGGCTVTRPLALVLTVALSVLLLFGCQTGPASCPASLRNAEPFTCEQSVTDGRCVSCLKAHCCGVATACNALTGHCACARECLKTGNTEKCAAECAAGEDKALGQCSATSCAAECGGG
jgi:hypothetical protein